MTQTTQTRRTWGAAGLDKSSVLGGGDGSENNPKVDVAQAKLALIWDDLDCNISAMTLTLESALAMHRACDVIGFVYTLRRARAYWLHIAASAAELTGAEAEQRSALRQGDAQ